MPAPWRADIRVCLPSRLDCVKWVAYTFSVRVCCYHPLGTQTSQGPKDSQDADSIRCTTHRSSFAATTASTGAIMHHTARLLARDHDATIYVNASLNDRRNLPDDGIDYRFIPGYRDEAVLRLLGRFPEPDRPEPHHRVKPLLPCLCRCGCA